jgi:hypothetical protein
MSLWARRGTFSLPPLTRVTFSLPLANDGCPYLPDFGRCGHPRTSTLTVPGATAMSVAGTPTLEPTRAGPQRLTPVPGSRRIDRRKFCFFSLSPPHDRVHPSTSLRRVGYPAQVRGEALGIPHLPKPARYGALVILLEGERENKGKRPGQTPGPFTSTERTSTAKVNEPKPKYLLPDRPTAPGW